MRPTKLAAALALGLCATAVTAGVVAGASNAAAPYGGNITFTYAPIGSAPLSDAYAFAASGVLKINPTIRSTCSATSHDAKYGLAALLPPLVTASTPNTGCTYVGGEGTNNTKIAEVSLLDGAIKVNGVDSECGVGPGGTGYAGSRIAYINGAPIGSGYGSLILPNLLEISYNNSEVLSDGTLINYALKVTVGKTITIGGHTFTIGQQVIVGECSVSP